MRLAAEPHQQILFHPELAQASGERAGPARLHSPMAELRVHCLSDRERQVLQYLAMESPTEMAFILNISVRTVETYRARVMLKLGLRSLAELVRYALRNNII